LAINCIVNSIPSMRRLHRPTRVGSIIWLQFSSCFGLD
jgi:hypothetical protein